MHSAGFFYIEQLLIIAHYRNHSITYLNSTRDDQEAQRIMDKLEAYLRAYHTNGWKYNSPIVQTKAIKEAENQLHRLNITSDAAKMHGEKLQDLCRHIDGSSHRKEACAKAAGQSLVTSSGMNDKPSNTETTKLLEKRAVSEEEFHTPMSQDSSVKSSDYVFTWAQCPGQSGYIPVEQVQDTTRCALIHYVSKAQDHLRRQIAADPTNEDDPARLRKLPFPESDYSLPRKRDDSNFEFENPEIHENTDVHFDVDWFSDWERDHSPTEQPIKRDRTDQEMTKSENHIEAEISTFTELENATEDAALDDVIEDTVEVFGARVMHDESHSSGKMNVTATFDPSNSRELEVSESVEEMERESEVAAGVMIESKHITTPADVVKNSTDKGLAAIVYNATGIAVMHEKSNSTARLITSRHHKRGLPESVRKLENEIGDKIEELFDEVNKPFAELKNATDKHNFTLSPRHIVDQKNASRHYGHHEIAHDPKTIEYCRKHKSQFVEAKDSPSGRATFCNKGYPITIPEDEFERVHNQEALVKYIAEIADKYQAHSRYDQDKPPTPEEEEGMRRMIEEQYEKEGFDPSTSVPVTPAEAKKGN